MQSTVKPSVVPKYSQMGYQTYKTITKTRHSNKQKRTNRSNFANHNYDLYTNNNISNPIANSLCTTRHQSQEHNFTQQIPQPVFQSVFFHEKRKTPADRTENHPFFQQNKNQQRNNSQEVNHIFPKMKITSIKTNNNTEKHTKR